MLMALININIVSFTHLTVTSSMLDCLNESVTIVFYWVSSPDPHHDMSS